MSADNWATCPQCKSNSAEKQKRRMAELDAAYGKIPSEKYLSMVEQMKAPVELESTLREDYEVGIWDGKFMVSYQGACSTCGFEFYYEYSQVPTPKPERKKSK